MLESARELREELMLSAKREHTIKITQNLLRVHVPIKAIKHATDLYKKEIKKIRKAMESNTKDQDL